ncbi:MAG: Flp family type IVb pilin [Alphaproteobacteria bacterium]
MLGKFLRGESAATSLEYALVAAIISVTAIGVLSYLGKSPTDNFENVGTSLADVTSDREGS